MAPWDLEAALAQVRARIWPWARTGLVRLALAAPDRPFAPPAKRARARSRQARAAAAGRPPAALAAALEGYISLPSAMEGLSALLAHAGGLRLEPRHARSGEVWADSVLVWELWGPGGTDGGGGFGGCGGPLLGTIYLDPSAGYGTRLLLRGGGSGGGDAGSLSAGGLAVLLGSPCGAPAVALGLQSGGRLGGANLALGLYELAHEMGHALHFLLAQHARRERHERGAQEQAKAAVAVASCPDWPSALAGLGVVWWPPEAAELASTLLEEVVMEPAALRLLCRHACARSDCWLARNTKALADALPATKAAKHHHQAHARGTLTRRAPNGTLAPPALASSLAALMRETWRCPLQGHMLVRARTPAPHARRPCRPQRAPRQLRTPCAQRSHAYLSRLAADTAVDIRPAARIPHLAAALTPRGRRPVGRRSGAPCSRTRRSRRAVAGAQLAACGAWRVRPGPSCRACCCSPHIESAQTLHPPCPQLRALPRAVLDRGTGCSYALCARRCRRQPGRRNAHAPRGRRCGCSLQFTAMTQRKDDALRTWPP